MPLTDFYSHDGIILVTNITELLLHGYSFTSTFELSSIITTTQTLFLIFIYHGNQYQSHICIYASLFFTYLSQIQNIFGLYSILFHFSKINIFPWVVAMSQNGVFTILSVVRSLQMMEKIKHVLGKQRFKITNTILRASLRFSCKAPKKKHILTKN